MKKTKIVITISSLILVVAMLGFSTFAALSTTATLGTGQINVAGIADFKIFVENVTESGNLIGKKSDDGFIAEENAVNASDIQKSPNDYTFLIDDLKNAAQTVVLKFTLIAVEDINFTLTNIQFIGGGDHAEIEYSLTNDFPDESTDGESTDFEFNGIQITKTELVIFAQITFGTGEDDAQPADPESEIEEDEDAPASTGLNVKTEIPNFLIIEVGLPVDPVDSEPIDPVH